MRLAQLLVKNNFQANIKKEGAVAPSFFGKILNALPK
jgi:hypothetical protein